MTGLASDELDEKQAEGLLELERAMADRFFIGLVGQLAAKFDNLGSAQVEDAVATAVERLLVRLGRRGAVRNVRAYLWKVAYNELRKVAGRDTEVPLDERNAPFVPPADVGLGRESLIALVKAEVNTWQNHHVRQVILVYIDLLVADEVLDSDQVAEIVSMNLNEQISGASVRTWKARGLRKLRAFIEGSEAR